MEKASESKDLDISDKTGRDGLFPPLFVPEEEIEIAVKELREVLQQARRIDELARKGKDLFQSPDLEKQSVKEEASLSVSLMKRAHKQANKQRCNEYNFAYTLEVSPGSIKIGRKSLKPKKENTEKSPRYRQRTVIREWSPKSRANMVARMCTLDYSPLLRNPLQPPAMITLTYPDKWEEVAPNGEAAKRHIFMLKKRYARAFGSPLIGVMKVEYQARNAPHFHILCGPPQTQTFKSWLADNWADIVNHPNPIEKEKHRLVGTHISYDKKYRNFDSKRISIYFLKHSAPNIGSKEYQNRPPQLWIDAGKVGRFWCYWGLKPLVRKVPISYREAVIFSRTLRRLSQSGKPMRRKVASGFIYKGNRTVRTGELRKRRVQVPVKRFPAILGFISVNNGARMTLYLARVLTLEKSGRC